MKDVLLQRLISSQKSTRKDYLEALRYFDITVREALAVSRAQAGRMAAPCLGYATYVFARMCSHGMAAVRAVPLSTWVKSDHEDWGFNVLACHARALLEGNLYFHYLVSPTDEALEEGRARITLLQLNDCCSRLKMLGHIPEQLAGFERQRDELQARLRSIPYFQTLPQDVQSGCLGSL